MQLSQLLFYFIDNSYLSLLIVCGLLVLIFFHVASNKYMQFISYNKVFVSPNNKTMKLFNTCRSEIFNKFSTVFEVSVY